MILLPTLYTLPMPDVPERGVPHMPLSLGNKVLHYGATLDTHGVLPTVKKPATWYAT